MKKQLRILIVQGHRNTSGGNPAESAITPLAARAIEKELIRVGHSVDMLQNTNNWFSGSLDAVGREVIRRFNLAPYDLMLDIHFEGDANNTRGMFAIVPDGDGLTTFTKYTGTDAIASNTLDMQYAGAISAAVAESSGLRLRQSGVVKPGVMSERQTGVGGNGFRLAMFGYTANLRNTMARLVLELGNIRGDADVIYQPGFYERVAKGVAEGIAKVQNASGVVQLPAQSGPVLPPFGTITKLEHPVLVSVTASALNARKWGQLNQPVMRVLAKGNSFWANGWIVGDEVNGNAVWWIMGRGAKTDLSWRVWSGGTELGVNEILALPTKEAA